MRRVEGIGTVYSGGKSKSCPGGRREVVGKGSEKGEGEGVTGKRLSEWKTTLKSNSCEGVPRDWWGGPRSREQYIGVFYVRKRSCKNWDRHC